MIRILIREWLGGISLMKRQSPYSIVTTPEIISLSVGWNEFQDLKYGFWFDSLSNIDKFIEKIDLSEYDTSNIIDMSVMFAACPIHHIKLNNFNTNNVISMHGMFCGCSELEKLDLSSFDTHNVTNISSMFLGCSSLTELDLSSFDVSNVGVTHGVFYGCWSLRKIKCKRSFKEWCVAHQSEINLPCSMREGGHGIWEIID